MAFASDSTTAPEPHRALLLQRVCDSVTAGIGRTLDRMADSRDKPVRDARGRFIKRSDLADLSPVDEADLHDAIGALLASIGIGADEASSAIESDAVEDVRRDLDALIAATEPRAELPPEPLLSAGVVPSEETSAGVPKSGETPSAPATCGDIPTPEPDTADRARAIHLRRQLEAAAEHGAALLSALGLPRLVTGEFIQVDPAAAGDALDQAIATLDALDPDPDLEDGADNELTGDDELSIGWTNAVSQLHLGHGSDDGEHTLGAPERHPPVSSMTGAYYRPANGSYYRAKRWESQASWAQGQALEGEGESEAGYDLREGDGSRSGEDDDDGLSGGEGDSADDEPTLGAPAGDGNQRRWAQGASTSNDPEADPTDNVRLYKGPAEWEATYARRPALHALVARARALRAAPPRDPDIVTPIGPGMGSWGGPMRHPLCNVSPVDARFMVAELSNLRELGT